jgi:HEAT repeat protein
MSNELFLIPKTTVTWDEMEEAMQALDATEEEPEEGFLFSWRVGDTLVRLFEDAVLHVQHFRLDGGDREAVAERLKKVIPTVTPKDMPALFDEIEGDESGEFEEKLGLLAAVAPKTADPPLVELFERGYNHPDPLVREHAALVSAVPRWPRLRASLERLANDDEDADVRESAATALSDFDKATRSD